MNQTLDFQPVTIHDKSLIDAYSFQYGENSCQHSFVSMYGHFEKYGDSFFEQDGWLYICRTHLNDEKSKVYMCPMGDSSGEESFKKAVHNLLADAATEGKKAVFYTITESVKQRMEKCLPGLFEFTYIRDCCEYLYSRKSLVELPGSQYSLRRRQCRLFDRNYSGRSRIEVITADRIPELLNFQHHWLEHRMAHGGDPGLYEENLAILRELSEFENLGLFGILIRLDGVIAGYAYGVPLSADCFDLLCIKGDRSVPYVYMALNRALPEMCRENFIHFNWEEDVGSVGLRTMKLRYYPEILMAKYRAVNIDL